MNVSTKRASIAAVSTVVAAGLVVGGVASTSDAATPAVKSATSATVVTKTVKIMGTGGSGMFMPSSVTIKVGSKVKWINQDSTVHTVTWNSTKYGLASKTLGPGSTFTVTFSKVGTFGYHCTRHLGMTGKIVVTK